MAIIFSCGRASSVAARSGTLLVMATVAPRRRSRISFVGVTGYSCQVWAKAGRRRFAFKEARSRNTTCSLMASALNGAGRVRRVELLFLAHLFLRDQVVRAPVVGRGRDTAAGRDLDTHVQH